jgi:hypothetical protein
MANEGETNPKNQTAPGSDSQWSGSYNREMVELLRNQLDNQEFQTKYIKELTEKIESSQREELNAKKKQLEAELKGDTAALAIAIKQYEEAKLSRSESTNRLREIQTDVAGTQRQITDAIEMIAIDSKTQIDVVKKELDASLDLTKQIADTLSDAKIKDKTILVEFKNWSKEFLKQSKKEEDEKLKAEKELSDRNKIEAKQKQKDEEENQKNNETKELAQEVRNALEQIKGSSNEDTINRLIERTGANIQSLSVVQKMLSDAMIESGVDLKDETAVMAFKANWAKEQKTQDKIIEKLTEMRDSIQKENIQKSIYETIVKQGVNERVAEIRAERLAEKQFREETQKLNKQISIFKNIEQASLIQIAAVERQNRQAVEDKKEMKELPEWYKDLKANVKIIDAHIIGLRDTMREGGWLFKLIAIITFATGLIVGMVSAAIAEVFGMITSAFKGGGIISRFFLYLKETFPAINKMINGMKSFFIFIKNGTAIGRYFVSVINRTIGVFTTFIAIIKDVQFGALGFIKILKSVFAPVIEIFKIFMTSFRLGYGIMSGLFRFLRVLRPIISLIGRAFLPLTIVLTLIDAVIGAFKGFKKDGIRGLLVGIFAGIIDGLTLGLIGFDKIYKFMNNIIDSITKAFKKILEHTYNAIKLIFKYSPIGLLVQGVMWIYNNFNSIINAAKETLMLLWKYSLPNLLYQGIKYGISAAKKIIDNMKTFIIEGIEKLQSFLLNYNPITLIYKGLVSLSEKIWAVISSVVPKLVDDFTENVESIFDAVKSIIPKLHNKLKKEVKSFFDAITNVIKLSKELVTNSIKNIPAVKIATATFEFFTGSSQSATPETAIKTNQPLLSGPKLFTPTETPFLRDFSFDENTLGPMGKKLKDEYETKQKALKPNTRNGQNTQTNVTTTNMNISSVNNKGGSRPHIIAPQPPRNTEPTFRQSTGMAHPNGLF